VASGQKNFKKGIEMTESTDRIFSSLVATKDLSRVNELLKRRDALQEDLTLITDTLVHLTSQHKVKIRHYIHGQEITDILPFDCSPDVIALYRVAYTYGNTQDSHTTEHYIGADRLTPIYTDTEKELLKWCDDYKVRQDSWKLRTAHYIKQTALSAGRQVSVTVECPLSQQVILAQVTLDEEMQDWVVKAFGPDCQRMPEADYYTDNLSDAQDTAIAMVDLSNSIKN
jgi:hypothetical protein